MIGVVQSEHKTMVNDTLNRFLFKVTAILPAFGFAAGRPNG
jgi:hypothetical protein